MSMQIIQVRNDLLSKLGIEDATLAGALVLQDVVVAINASGQLLQTAGQDYFTRELLDIGIYAGTSIYQINRSIQSILGPVRLGTKPLFGLESQGQYDQFDRIFNDGAGYGPGSGEPQAYWPKYLKNGTAGDICDIEMYFAPTPTVPATVTIEVVKDWVELVVADLDSTAELPVAQDYTESIFLPLARMLITRSSQFSRPDLLAQLTSDAQSAMQRLGLSGGFPNQETPAPPRRTKG